MVSIITPCHNSARFISETIMSVLKQTYQDFELIIVDDCSTDDSLLVIQPFLNSNSNIILVPLKENVGAAEARNVALRLAMGRYIAFIDSDDIWEPTKLERQLNFMVSNNYSFTFTSYRVIDENGILTNRKITAPRKISYSGYLKNTIIGCLTVVVDKQQIGYFEMPNIRSSHDMALWLLILKRGYNAYGLDETLGYYRIVGNSNSAKKGRAAFDVWASYRRFEGLSFCYSLYCFLGYAFNAIKKRVI